MTQHLDVSLLENSQHNGVTLLVISKSLHIRVPRDDTQAKTGDQEIYHPPPGAPLCAH